MFLELLENEQRALEEVDDLFVDLFIESFEGDKDELLEFFDLTDEEAETICEQMVKRVNSQGKIRKTLSRQLRSRRAAMTTGMSKSQLKIRARKAARTKRKNPMIQVKALRKRKKAMRKRKQLGLR